MWLNVLLAYNCPEAIGSCKVCWAPSYPRGVMPGHYVTLYALPALLPRAYWPSDMQRHMVHYAPSIVNPSSNPSQHRVYGFIYLQSTRRQDLRYYEVFFTAVPLSGSWDELLRAIPPRSTCYST